MSAPTYCPECSWATPRHASGCDGERSPQAAVVAAPRPSVWTEAQIQVTNSRPEAFSSPAGLGKFAFLGLVYLFMALLFSIFTALRYRGVLAALDAGTYEGTLQDAIDIENAYGFSGILDLVGVLVIAVTWLFWMRRLRANTVALGRTPEYRPAWIFWGWVTPILNYFRPYQVIRDLWQKSDPAPGRGTANDPPRYYLWWWVTYVVTGRVSVALVRSLDEPETLDQVHSMVTRLLFLDLVELPSLVLAVLVIRSLTQRQIDAGAELGRHLS